MSADWEEVKRLAADLQKAQLSSTLQRLSERNVIEIVTRLIETKILNVIFTNDGKEYITPEQLINEIRSELYAHGGRINLVDLSKLLRVDLNPITNYSRELQKEDGTVHLVFGQLIDQTYIDRISSEINEKLAQVGRVYVDDLTVQFDLPSDFLLNHVISKQLGKLIDARQDPNDPKLLFTEEFAQRAKAKIRGALAGVTKPTSINAILGQTGLQDSIFFMLLDQVPAAGNVTGKQIGSMYIPHIYSKSQTEWINNFYRQNRYLEYDALKRLGVIDPKSYIERHFAKENLISLNDCVVSQTILDLVEGAIDECIASKSCVDVQTLLPSNFSDEDINMIIEHILTPSRKKRTLLIDNCILSTAYLELLAAPCEALCQQRANETIESGKYQQYLAEKQISSRTGSATNQVDTKAEKREERRKKAVGGKSGGGTQGRETKTKAVKKHPRTSKNQTNDSDEEIQSKQSSVLNLITIKDIENLIEDPLEEDGISHFLKEIATHLQSELNPKALEVANTLYVNLTANSASARRQNHTAFQEKLNALISDVRLFEKGLKQFPSDVQGQLVKYLLKTICSDIANDILLYVATESELNLTNLINPLTQEQRVKISNDVPKEFRTQLQDLVKALSGASIEEFLTATEECLPACSMILKKVDKKKDRLLILNHKHGLIDQLQQCDDPALVLHLASLILFASVTQCMLHASGRHVIAIITFLKQHLPVEDYNELSKFHDLVTQCLGGGSDKERIISELNNKIDTVKNLAINYKKPSQPNDK